MKKLLPQYMAIREARDRAKLTQEALAKKAKISIQYVKMIEGGYNCSDDVKRKVAKALGYSVWALFPEVKGEVDLYNILLSRHRPNLVIRDDQVAMFKEVLYQMNQDEFEGLIMSGTDADYVNEKVREWARTHEIEVVD